ncbi:hypothetical protein D9615_007940 [Tricholomella constricta]|uniref:F-box domain-containing protein n=1 Tax=Tricholomella constricta TaxID=117010 RepID=A0A8H5H1U2_9AGAR|nr:hypothetical protein D9615_007940 [Tricholomella constricta]
MNPCLETIPRDVLQHIAYLLATASPTEPPRHLLPLLLTSSKIHRALNVHDSPHLYANIFRATFDTDHALHSRLTDSMLADELLVRHRILWRTRRNDLSFEPTLEEVWAAVRMVLEDSGRNDVLLAEAGLSTFIMTYVRHRLARAAADLPSSGYSDTMYMVLWLLSLILTHQDVVNTPEATRDELRKLLRFTSISTLASNPRHLHWEHKNPYETTKPALHIGFDSMDHSHILERTIPIIIIIFALNEAVPIAIPSHIPETRALAIASQRSGPTAEDFRSIADRRTPLFAEIRQAQMSGANPTTYISNPAHWVAYESRLRPILYSSYLSPKYVPGHVYVPGSLAGLWDGCLMVSSEPMPSDPLSPPILGEFRCLKPMQCAITEYLCFSPHLPIPSNYSADFLESAVKSSGFRYEKYSPASNDGNAKRDHSKALDVIFLGKTLHDHEQAWNDFKFVGRVRSDGFIVMYREPKSQADERGLGTWIFEGHLQYGVAFVGQWRSSIPTATSDMRGIFSLRKTDAGWQDC